MAKVHTSLRIDEELADRIEALRYEGESTAAAYSRAIAAGLDAMERDEIIAEVPHYEELLEAKNDELRQLRERISTADEVTKLLKEQITTKDAQLDTLGESLKAAQTTAAMALQRRQGLFSRLLNRGDDSEPVKAKWND